MLCTWLSERLDHSLHLYQCTCLAHIVKKIYSDFELQGVIEEKLNSTTYQTISKRMQTEEASCALTSVQNEEWVFFLYTLFFFFFCSIFFLPIREQRYTSLFPPFLFRRGLSENGNDDEVERPKPKVTVVETVNSEDANIISNVTSNVVEKVGSMFGKGIGGFSTKFGGPSWFWSFFLYYLITIFYYRLSFPHFYRFLYYSILPYSYFLFLLHFLSLPVLLSLCIFLSLVRIIIIFKL